MSKINYITFNFADMIIQIVFSKYISDNIKPAHQAMIVVLSEDVGSLNVDTAAPAPVTKSQPSS